MQRATLRILKAMEGFGVTSVFLIRLCTVRPHEEKQQKEWPGAGITLDAVRNKVDSLHESIPCWGTAAAVWE
jgi:hypothetical protein